MPGWEMVRENFKGTNLDPQRMACGCAIKVDLQRVVYPALLRIRPQLEALGVSIAPRQDADITPLYGQPQIQRIVSSLERPPAEVVERLRPERAITVTSVYRAGDPKRLAERWLHFYRQLMIKRRHSLFIGKGHTIEAYSPADEFILFDFYKTKRGLGHEVPPQGYLVANNDTIQLIDPTRPLDDYTQTAAALSNALNDLFALGAVEKIRIYPLYAAPTDTLRRALEANMRCFCASYGFELIAQPPISERTLLLGATVFGETRRQTPTFYDKLAAGDQILVHRPFGDLAPINLYLESLIVGDGYWKQLGIAEEEALRAKEETVGLMAQPNLAVGQLIQRYCPGLGEPFDPERHIKVTGDLSGPGIDIFRELAEFAHVNVRLEAIPLRAPRIVGAASEGYLIANGTSGTNGALAIVASLAVIARVHKELCTLGYRPEMIGRIEGPGQGLLSVPAETRRFISAWPEEYRIQPELGTDGRAS